MKMPIPPTEPRFRRQEGCISFKASSSRLSDIFHSLKEQNNGVAPAESDFDDIDLEIIEDYDVHYVYVRWYLWTENKTYEADLKEYKKELAQYNKDMQQYQIFCQKELALDEFLLNVEINKDKLESMSIKEKEELIKKIKSLV